MRERTLSRRRAIELTGLACAGATGGLAGCLGDDESDGGAGTSGGDADETTHPYERWLSASNADATFRAETLELNGFAGSDAVDHAESPDDPLFAVPLRWLTSVVFSSFTLQDYAVDYLTTAEGPADRLSRVPEAMVLDGDFDVGTLQERVEGAGLEQVAQHAEYQLYAGEPEGMDGGSALETGAIALDESTVVATRDDESDGEPRQTLEELLDVRRGERDRLGDGDERFDELAAALPDVPYRAVEYDPDGEILASADDGPGSSPLADLDLADDVTGVATSLDATDERTIRASLVLQYRDSGLVDDRNRIEEQLGFGAGERSVTIDGRLASIEGEFGA